MRFVIVSALEVLHTKLFQAPMGDKMREFLIKLGIIFIGMISASSIFFVLNVVAARTLGPVEYGKFQMIYAMAQFIIVVMLLGLNMSSVKYLSECTKESERRKIKNTILSSVTFTTLFFASLLLFFGGYFSGIFSIDPLVFTMAVFLAVLLSFYHLFRSLLQGLQKMTPLSILEFVYALVALFIFFVIIYLKNDGFISIYLAFSVGYGVFTLLSLFAVRRSGDIALFDYTIFKKMIHYGIYAIFGSIAWLSFGVIDKLIINKFFEADVLGVYAAYFLASTVVFAQFMNIFAVAFFPQSSAVKNKIGVARKLNKLSLPIFFLASFLSLGITSIILEIIGASYPLSVAYVILFAINAGLISVYQPKMWLLNADGVKGVRATVRGTLSAGFLNLFLGLISIPLYGISGAIISSIVANLVLVMYFTMKINQFFIYEKND